MRNKKFSMNNKVPDETIEIEKRQFDCPNCGRPFFVAKMPDWMGSDYHKDMLELKEKQLTHALSFNRELEYILLMAFGREKFNFILKETYKRLNERTSE